ncbi:DUF2993 domain-containing protein [Streptomyces axinellae]|uniref:DUF2993 domain-containing protein n=1 Tax=Streptomyces axinellae TaxID=552788 RepID=A0ABN3QD52_9ACTN
MRALRIGLVVLVVLAGLFVAADRIAVGMAEDEAADRLKNELDLPASTKASVSIGGFPFLTQAAFGNLDKVSVDVGSITASTGGRQVRLTDITMEAREVAFASDLSSAVADHVTGSVHISYADLSKAADEGVRVGYGGKNKSGKDRVKVTASVMVPLVDHPIERSVLSTVSVAGGDTLRLHAREVPGHKIPGVESTIRRKIDFERRIDQLPEGLKLEKVKTTRTGIDLSMTGSDISLAR